MSALSFESPPSRPLESEEDQEARTRRLGSAFIQKTGLLSEQSFARRSVFDAFCEQNHFTPDEKDRMEKYISAQLMRSAGDPWLREDAGLTLVPDESVDRGNMTSVIEDDVMKIGNGLIMSCQLDREGICHKSKIVRACEAEGYGGDLLSECADRVIEWMGTQSGGRKQSEWLIESEAS